MRGIFWRQTFPHSLTTYITSWCHFIEIIVSNAYVGPSKLGALIVAENYSVTSRLCEIGRIPSPPRNQTAAAAAPRSSGQTIFGFFLQNTRSSVSFLLRFHGNWENKQTNYLISSNSPFLNWLDWRLYRETWKLGRIQEYFKGARICGAKASPLHPP